MDERTLYATIRGGVRPVTRVEFDDAAKTIHVWLAEQSGTTYSCPECQTVSPLHDHVERSWRHPDTCQYETRARKLSSRKHAREAGQRPMRCRRA